MADVRLTIAGRFYDVSTSDGEEQRLLNLAAIVDEKARTIIGTTESRQLLFAALKLADELQEKASGKPAADQGLESEAAELKQALAEAAQKIDTLERAVDAARQEAQAAEGQARAALEQATASQASAKTQLSSAQAQALSHIADRIENIAEKFEQLS